MTGGCIPKYPTPPAGAANCVRTPGGGVPFVSCGTGNCEGVPAAVAAVAAVVAVVAAAAAPMVPLSAPVVNAERVDAVTDPARFLRRRGALGKEIPTGFSVAVGLLAQHRDSTIV